MAIYFFIGVFLISSFIISEFTNDKNIEKFLYIISFLILFFIAGFRTYEVGSDSISYVNLYESFSYGGIFEPDIFKFFTGRIEYGFLLTNKFLYSISSSYVLLFSSFSFFTLFITFYVIKKISPNIFLSLIIFFGYRIYTFSMTALRASSSIVICILAFYFFMVKKKKLAFLTIILASAFHLSALLFLIIFIIDYIKINYKIFFLSILVAFVLYFNLNYVLRIVFNIFDKYEGYAIFGTVIDRNLDTILNFLVVLSVFIFGEIIFKNRKDAGLLFLRKIMFLNVLISFIAINVPMLGRFTLLFGSLTIFYLPMLVERVYSFNNRVIFKFLIVFAFLLHFYIILILKPEWNVLFPYKNVILELFL